MKKLITVILFLVLLSGCIWTVKKIDHKEHEHQWSEWVIHIDSTKKNKYGGVDTAWTRYCTAKNCNSVNQKKI